MNAQVSVKARATLSCMPAFWQVRCPPTPLPAIERTSQKPSGNPGGSKCMKANTSVLTGGCNLATRANLTPSRHLGCGIRYPYCRTFRIVSTEGAISASPTLRDQSAFTPWIDHVVGAFPTPAYDATCVPFMNQIATLPPLSSCQRRSLLPSPLKSPVPTIAQAVGTVPIPANCVTCAPFKNHIATLPLTSRQSRSALPWPLKSRCPTIVHT